jgi:hypothetical protein
LESRKHFRRSSGIKTINPETHEPTAEHIHARAFTQEDWVTMMNFFDKYSRGIKADKTFDHFLTDAERDAATSAP